MLEGKESGSRSRVREADEGRESPSLAGVLDGMPEHLRPEWQENGLIALKYTGNGEVALRLTFKELEALHRWAEEGPAEAKEATHGR